MMYQKPANSSSLWPVYDAMFPFLFSKLNHPVVIHSTFDQLFAQMPVVVVQNNIRQ
mgnify:CR=1